MVFLLKMLLRDLSKVTDVLCDSLKDSLQRPHMWTFTDEGCLVRLKGLQNFRRWLFIQMIILQDNF